MQILAMKDRLDFSSKNLNLYFGQNIRLIAADIQDYD